MLLLRRSVRLNPIRITSNSNSATLQAIVIETIPSSVAQITCGSVYHVALALAGAKLAKHAVVQAKEVHGVHSEGMLCSASELGLSEDATSILEIRHETPAWHKTP